MGFRMNWIATPVAEREHVLKAFGLEPDGDAEDELAADYTCAETPDGWLILVHSRFRNEVRDVLVGLSENGQAYGFSITEIVNFCEAVAFDHGRLIWGVTRDADAGEALIIEGEPPDLFAEIRQRLEAEQAADPDTDILIDAPVELLHKLIGYRMDQESGLSWTALKSVGDAPVTASPKRTPVSLRLLRFLVRLVGA
jgi:hypothetical protein